MAQQVTTVSGDIPDILSSYYTGTDKFPGLLERAQQAIYGGGPGAAGYDTTFGSLTSQAVKDVYGPQGLIGAGRVAGITPGSFTEAAGERLMGMGQGLPSAFGAAEAFGGAAGAGLTGLQNLQAMGVAAPELTQYQLAGPQMFGAQQAQQYMSPYMQGVVDIQQRKAIEAAKQAQLGQNLGAARQGTYGGARQTLLQGARESGLRQQLGDIQTQGLESAYQQAQQQFERDRAAQMGVGQQNLAAALGVQQLGAGQSLEAQRANQAAALQAAQQRAQASTGLAGLAGTMGGLGTQQLAGQMDVTKAIGAYGDLERAIDQQRRDAQAQYLQERAQYGLTQAGQLSNILRGVPVTNTTQVTTTPPPSFASQLTGMGLTGIGLYNLLGGGKQG
jgi:hypothetical protein